MDSIILVPKFDKQGVVHLPSLSFPLPESLSAQAKIWMRQLYRSLYSKQPDFQLTSDFLAEQQLVLQKYAAKIERIKYADVHCDVIQAGNINPSAERQSIVLHLVDEASLNGTRILTSGILLATKLNATVVVPAFPPELQNNKRAVLAQLTDVYRVLLTRYRASDIVVSGEVQGADLAASLMVKLFQDNLPAAAALGLLGFSGSASEWLSQNRYLDAVNSHMQRDVVTAPVAEAHNDSQDPLLNPLVANMAIFPPVYLACGMRDSYFDTCIALQRELRKAGTEVQLHLFDGLPQFYYLNGSLPETGETFLAMARFINAKLCENADV